MVHSGKSFSFSVREKIMLIKSTLCRKEVSIKKKLWIKLRMQCSNSVLQKEKIFAMVNICQNRFLQKLTRDWEWNLSKDAFLWGEYQIMLLFSMEKSKCGWKIVFSTSYMISIEKRPSKRSFRSGSVVVWKNWCFKFFLFCIYF